MPGATPNIFEDISLINKRQNIHNNNIEELPNNNNETRKGKKYNIRKLVKDLYNQRGNIEGMARRIYRAEFNESSL